MALAGVVRLEVTERSDVPTPAAARSAGPYERIVGKVHFAPDPNLPPTIGRQYPVFLPQVDSDGNELSGIRLPWIQVPLATYTGWNLRDPSVGGSEELYSFAGSTLPFAKTRAEREKNGDPRPSIAERYKSRHEHLDRVHASIRELTAGGYLLELDAGWVAEQAGRQWDNATK